MPDLNKLNPFSQSKSSKTKSKSNDKAKKKKPKKKRKKKRFEGKPQMFHSMWGDKDKRTKRNVIFLVMLVATIIGAIITTIWLISGFYKYHQYQKNNTTEIGTELEYSKSGAKVTISSVWTDTNRDVAMIRLSYDKTARNLLSTNGKNYKLYLIDKNGTKPKDLHLAYGVLGTEGDGYLFVKGNLEEQAYTFLITNQVELDAGSDAGASADDDPTSSSDVISQDADDVTTDSIKSSLAEVGEEDIDDNGILNFSNKTATPDLDYITFRVNAFSDSTKVYKGSFLDDKGEIDYQKLIRQTSLQQKVKQIDEKIKQKEKQDDVYGESIKEYDSRLKENKDDEVAKENLENVKESRKQINEELENLKKIREKYEQANFGREDFGEMQTDYKATPLN